jgi:sigma-E factor negative regulatory protein RseC
MIECGIVEGIEGKFALVKIKRDKEACTSCSARELCLVEMKDYIYVYNSLDSKIGDTVEIEIKERAKWLSMILLFVLPIFMLIIGVLIGNSLGEKIGGLFGLLFLILYFIFLFIFESIIKKRKGFIRMIRILKNEDNKN